MNAFSKVCTAGFLVLLYLACTNDANAGSDGTAVDKLYYCYQGRQVPLVVNPEKIGVYLDSAKAADHQEALLAADSDLLAVDVYEPAVGLATFVVKPGLSYQAVLTRLAALGTRAGVQDVSPAFVAGGQIEAYLTPSFIVSFRPEVTQAEIDAMNKAYGVEVLSMTRSEKEGPTRCLLTAPGRTVVETLVLTNQYSEEKGVGYSTPNFAMADTLLSAVYPNDYWYQGANCTTMGFDEPWHHTRIHLPEAWDLVQGASAVPTIAVLDTGVDVNHPDLVGSLWQNPGEGIADDGVDDDHNGQIDDHHGWDFCENDNDPSDLLAHGTCCAGLAAAVANNGIGVAGVSWNAKLMPVRITCLLTTVDMIANGITYAWTNGADVISYSGGVRQPSDDIDFAIKTARAWGRAGRGTVLVCGAGNDGTDSILYPANRPDTIAVGGIDKVSNRAEFPALFGIPQSSCYGPQLDVVAPSVALWTTDIAGRVLGSNAVIGWGDGNYVNDFSGTSGATPIVAGVAALILSLYPDLTASQVQAAICFSAEDKTGNPQDDEGRDTVKGYGVLNAYEALKLADAPRVVVKGTGQKHVVSFDDRGNIIVDGDGVGDKTEQGEDIVGRGDLVTSASSMPASSNLSIRLGSTAIDCLQTTPFSCLSLTGKLYETVTVDLDAAVSCPSVRVRNNVGQTVALVNSVAFVDSSLEKTPPNVVPAGSLILKGHAFVGKNPDRPERQAH